jgi:hypothetical protein
MKTYPIELRQKIVDAFDQQLGTYNEIGLCCTNLSEELQMQ